VVIASNVGADRDPLWWQNLKAHPNADVRIGPKRVAIRAREAQDTERQLLWAKIVERDTSYAEYERRTKRRIPVVLLEPKV
jgi:F420H(2)-dependent quinone reductase